MLTSAFAVKFDTPTSAPTSATRPTTSETIGEAGAEPHLRLDLQRLAEILHRPREALENQQLRLCEDGDSNPDGCYHGRGPKAPEIEGRLG